MSSIVPCRHDDLVQVPIGWALLWLPVLIILMTATGVRCWNLVGGTGDVPERLHFCNAVPDPGVAIRYTGNLSPEHGSGEMAEALHVESHGWSGGGAFVTCC